MTRSSSAVAQFSSSSLVLRLRTTSSFTPRSSRVLFCGCCRSTKLTLPRLTTSLSIPANSNALVWGRPTFSFFFLQPLLKVLQIREAVGALDDVGFGQHEAHLLEMEFAAAGILRI